MKRQSTTIFTTTILMLGGTLTAWAQDPAAPAADAATPAPTVSPLFFNPTFWLIGGLFIVMFIAIVVLTRSMTSLTRSAYGLKDAENAENASAAKTEAPTFWQDFDRKVLTKAVPVEREKDILFEHGYDGIHELDNDLPPWWKWGFYFTILFAFVYVAHFHVFNTGKSQREEYKQEIADARAAQEEMMAKNAGMVTADNVTLLTDAAAISAGKETFTKLCVACHGPDGGGLVGPNLTDEYWLHGGGIKNVFKTITEGVPAKGMISWKSQLSPKQIQEVASFVLSLKGTTPASPKAPQGDIWTDPNAAATPAADSTVVAAADSTVKK